MQESRHIYGTVERIKDGEIISKQTQGGIQCCNSVPENPDLKLNFIKTNNIGRQGQIPPPPYRPHQETCGERGREVATYHGDFNARREKYLKRNVASKHVCTDVVDLQRICCCR